MTFTTIEFLVLFAVTCLLYFSLRRAGQNVVILVASIVFYGWWDWRFLFLVIASTIVDYVCAIRIHDAPEPRRKRILVVALVANLGTLALFKYLDFFVQSAAAVIEAFGGTPNVPLLNLILPLGISFYTFHELSYLIDVYRRQSEPERNYFLYLSFVMFFPLLVAGPIERGWHLLPQLKTDRVITAKMVWSGLLLCAGGFVKKLVIADNVAVIANHGFGSTTGGGGMHLVAIYAFAIQIYCDFSAYSDIARGTARILGFDVFQNFNLPYLTTNPRQFWRCWHISLSSWFRDYVYIPLGGNRGSRARTLRNLVITMLLCGLWHGAAWVYVAWGAFHGALFVLYDFWSRSRLGQWLSARRSGTVHLIKSVVFFQAVCLGWLLFRAESLSQAGGMLRSIAFDFSVDAGVYDLAIRLAMFAAPLLAVQLYQKRSGLAPWDGWRTEYQALTIVAAVMLVGLLGAPSGTEFIYFQF